MAEVGTGTSVFAWSRSRAYLIVLIYPVRQFVFSFFFLMRGSDPTFSMTSSGLPATDGAWASRLTIVVRHRMTNDAQRQSFYMPSNALPVYFHRVMIQPRQKLHDHN